MSTSKGHLIDLVSPESPAACAGIKPGWRLLRIDNCLIGDIIDYKIVEADGSLRLILIDEKGYLRRIMIEKPAGLPLGLSFDPPTLTAVKRCSNKCIFCFVDQNPPGMRSALYLKDDDYRLSFLYGNFITLNRLTDAEVERIVKLQLSPLYVSVHTTKNELRRNLFGTKNAARGMAYLKKLVKAGIRIHAQVVLCPGYNSGQEMEQTIADLAELGDNIADVALVPVGLTAHRHGLADIRNFTREEALALVCRVRELQQQFLQNRKKRFLFAADEFYIMAGTGFPSHPEYEEYTQLENGVGLARQLLNELEIVKKKIALLRDEPIKVTIATGKAAEVLIKKMLSTFSAASGLKIQAVYIENSFFGNSVNVAGLLTGNDLLTALRGKKLGDIVFITAAMLRDKSEHFLDNVTLSNIKQELQVPVVAVSGPLEMFEVIKNFTAVNADKKKGKKEN